MEAKRKTTVSKAIKRTEEAKLEALKTFNQMIEDGNLAVNEFNLCARQCVEGKTDMQSVESQFLKAQSILLQHTDSMNEAALRFSNGASDLNP
ncbi:hypothetical protein BOX15_Mlig022999g1 [Macrostomum lignano]|uniref:Uncharacterized protein n=2 Tax=Macrostomum lignano TaxID=282301 RepID=A0A267GNW0_9PLAT|nr:hypothetical protein BOX15_Mlig022999g1 [Macrostomum lignano]